MNIECAFYNLCAEAVQKRRKIFAGNQSRRVWMPAASADANGWWPGLRLRRQRGAASSPEPPPVKGVLLDEAVVSRLLREGKLPVYVLPKAGCDNGIK